MDDLTKELLNLKKELEERKLKRAEAKGRLDELYRQLKEQFNCESIAEAEAYKKELEDEVSDLQEQIEAGLAEVKTLLGK